MSSLGSDLTLAISAPLAAFGISAVQQAGELESLKLAMRSTFETAGRSIQDADKELEALRESALAPGLDFEQAVRGSIRLQGVQVSAEQARKTIESMANAIALTGGTADNLDSVTRQFSQMISKNRILQEDLTVISENMPIISRLMQDAFGTTSAEALRDMGISGQKFVEEITKAAQALPKVQGGIKNAIVNAGAALRQSLADIGDEINKVFDLGAKADQFTAFLRSTVDWFKGLDDGTKKVIVQVGLFAVALGPAVKILGVMQSTSAQAISLFRSMSGTLGTVANVVWETARAFNALSLAQKATIIGLAIGAVTALYTAFKILNAETTAAEDATLAFAQATSETQAEAAKELAVLNKNIDVLKSTTSGTKERTAAVSELIATYPEYLKGIDLEKKGVGELDEIQKKLTRSIIQGIAERKKAAAINTIYEQQANLLLRIQQIRDGAKLTTGETLLIDTGDMIRAGGIANAVIEKLSQKVNALNNEVTKTGAEFDRAFGLNSPVAASGYDDDFEAAAERLNAMGLGAKSVSKGFSEVAKNSGKVKTDTEKTKDAVESIKKAIDAIKNATKDFKPLPLPIGNVPERQPDPPGGPRPVVSGAPGGPPALPPGFGAPAPVLDPKDIISMSTKMERYRDLINQVGDAFQTMAEKMGSAIADGTATWKLFASAAVDALGDVIRAQVQAYVATIIANNAKFSAFLGPAAVPVSIAAGALASGLARGLLNRIGKFASGGVFKQPTLGLFGEYAGASNNPEIATPENLLRNIFRQEVSGGGAPQELFARISGDALVLVTDRAREKQRRIR